VTRPIRTYPLRGVAAFFLRHQDRLLIAMTGPGTFAPPPEEMRSRGSAPTPVTCTSALAGEYASAGMRVQVAGRIGWRHVSMTCCGWPGCLPGSPKKRSRMSPSTRRALQVNRAAGPACPAWECAPTSWEACYRPTLIRSVPDGWCGPHAARGSQPRLVPDGWTN
jgi:hypothetical protein